MFEPIKKYLDSTRSEFDKISLERKLVLEKISNYIQSKQAESKPVNLVYICTHNSRRSHFGQIWAHIAADYFSIKNVHTFSGGTETTAFNPNAISAIERVGFSVKKISDDKNPIFEIFHSEDAKPSICFSKVFNHHENPSKEFAAIITCSDAEENCPFIPEVDLRIGTTYDDPKNFDETSQQDEKYDERCRQIARETVYVFSKVND
jgi:protein-tyrosine-phosphatase